MVTASKCRSSQSGRFFIMAKDPAVLFYTSDFLSGTFTMTDEQVGKYMRLLCIQHQKGMLSETDMLSICKAYDEQVFSKFVKEGDFFYNERMKFEAERRKKFTESRKNNAQHSKNQSSTHKKAYAKHMETETETINENIIINKGDFFSIEQCLEISLKDPRWIKAIKVTQDELIRFNQYLESKGIYEMLPAEYKSYFSNVKGRYPKLVIKELTIEDFRKAAEEYDKLNSKQ